MEKRRSNPWGLILIIGVWLLASACEQNEEPAPESRPEREQPHYDGIIVAMGDSLTAGLGVAPADSYPAQLERLLHERGFAYRVVNSGISGETSSGARSRTDWVISMEPDIVILETGANDGLRGIEPALVQENIDSIITAFQQRDVVVVLAGMRMLANMGADYLQAFNRIYPDLARKHQVVFVPFFLEGVALDPELNQSDGIHPNEQGYRAIANHLLPYVLEAIERQEAAP